MEAITKMDVDCLRHKVISEENVKYFEKNGVLILRNAISPQVSALSCISLLLIIEELEQLRDETNHLISSMDQNLPEDNWYNDEIPSQWYASMP
jgi:hypothetical protein